MIYTLLLQGGRVVEAHGDNPLGACQHNADKHPNETVIAWDNYRGLGETIAAIPIEATPKNRKR